MSIHRDNERDEASGGWSGGSKCLLAPLANAITTTNQEAEDSHKRRQYQAGPLNVASAAAALVARKRLAKTEHQLESNGGSCEEGAARARARARETSGNGNRYDGDYCKRNSGRLPANSDTAAGNNGFKQLVAGAGSNGSSSNNNNNKSNKSSYYSKIFGQYLPSSFNLNYTPNSADHIGRRRQQQQQQQTSTTATLASGRREEDQDDDDQQQQRQRQRLEGKSDQRRLQRESIGDGLELERDQEEALLHSSCSQTTTGRRGHSPIHLTKSIASALSRFRISSSAVAANSTPTAPGSSLSCWDPSARVRATNDNSEASGRKLFACEETEDCGASARTQTGRVKRKGFLHLKRSGFTLTSSSSTSACGVNSKQHKQAYEENKSIVAANQHQHPGQQQQQSASSRWRVHHSDLNNNSISNLFASACHVRDAEHRECLINEEADDEEDPVIERSITTNNNQHQHQQAKNKIKMATTKSSSSKSRNGGSAKTDKRALMLAGCGLIVATVLVLVSGARLAMALQAPSTQLGQQPFSRSQPTNINGQLSTGNSPVGDIRGPSSPQPAAGSLVANVNCNKIRGHITLTPNLQGGTTVSTQITAGPPGEVYQWSIHQFPIKPGAAMCSCSPLILGTKLIDLSEMHGNLPSDQEFNVQSSLNLFGLESPVGHSVLLRGMKTGMVACATFLPTSRKSNYRAKFHTPLSGSVTIFQTAFGTSFISHLMYSNGTRRHSMHRFDLVRSDDDVVTTSLLSGVQIGSATPSSGRIVDQSQAALEQREHENELGACKRFTSGEPLFKNLTYQLAVSTENFGMRGRTAIVLPHIPFETFSSVYVVVYSEHNPSEPIACAPLRFVKPKTAAAKFQTVSVQGSVVFSQDSPYDVTIARVNLNFPNSDGHSYGIDELPMIIRRKSDTRVCPNIREIIYNPHHVEPSSVPPEGEATSDQYAVGDLSGKYGSLTGKSTEKIQVNDYNLPLFGPSSIVGRAMTIYSADGVAIACSNVELTTPMTTAFATFDYGIQGQFIFRQPMNDCNGDTYVYIEVSKPTVSPTAASSVHQHSDHLQRSLDHNWHIHVNPVDSGLDHLSTTDCTPAGAHFNPYNTSTSTIYSRDCTPFNVLRCELGDLSAKMFTIEIPPYRVKGGQEPDIGKFFGTDIDLPLCGPVSIVNRSVVVHVADFGPQRLACSTVIEFKPRT